MVSDWYATRVTRGFAALEVLAQSSNRPFLFSDTPGLAELCLVPQMYNARRFEVDLSPYPNLNELDEKCREVDAFRQAAPEAVKPG